jgi:hypothetical protein
MASSLRRGRRHRAHLAILGIYLALGVLWFWSTWSAPTGTYVGYAGDPQAHMWYLRWVPYSLTHLKNPFFTHYLGWPSGVNVMWNNANAVVAPALLLYPVSTVFGVVFAFNVMATLAVVLSAFCAYLVCARYVRNPVAAAAGGLLYGFSPYMAAQSLGHIGLTIVVVPPLVFLLLDSLLVRRSVSPMVAGLTLGLLGAAQLVTAEELVATTFIAGGVAVAVLAALHPQLARERAGAAAGALVVAAAVLVLGAAPLAVQFLGPLRVRGLIRPPDLYVTDLLNFVLPTSLQLIHPSFVDPIVSGFTGNASEWNGYVGVGLIVLLLITAVALRRVPVVPVMVFSALLIAVFSMGQHLHVAGHVTSVPLPWRAGRIPLLGQILPSRLMLYFYLFAAVLLALFVESVARSGSTRMRLGGLALTLLALVPLAPAWPYPHGLTPEPAFFREGATGIPAGSVALVAPFSRLDYDAMQWQADADMRFRMPEGNYLRPSPDGGPFVGPLPNVTSDAMERIQRGDALPEPATGIRPKVLADMRALQVETVVVGPMTHEDAMVAFFTLIYGRPPQAEGGVYTWHGQPPG